MSGKTVINITIIRRSAIHTEFMFEHSHKETDSLETRDMAFYGEFLANLNETTLLWLNLQRDGTGNELSNTKDTFAESLQLQVSILHQSMFIFKSGLSSSFYG